MVAKKYENPEGGLNDAGRKKFGVKSPISSGTNARRISYAARFGGMDSPMKDSKGRPTRYALTLKKWGFSSAAEARAFASKHKKSKISKTMTA